MKLLKEMIPAKHQTYCLVRTNTRSLPTSTPVLPEPPMSLLVYTAGSEKLTLDPPFNTNELRKMWFTNKTLLLVKGILTMF